MIRASVRYRPPKLNDCKVDYIGYITQQNMKHFVGVRLYGDDMFIRKCYPGENGESKRKEDYLTLEWTINPKGRILQIGAFLNEPNQRPVRILNVPGAGHLKQDWDWTTAYANGIPEKTSMISPDFLNSDQIQGYAILLQKGHELSQEILEHLSAGTVQDPERLSDRQKSLKDIITDGRVMGLLEITSKLCPSTDTCDAPKMITLTYN